MTWFLTKVPKVIHLYWGGRSLSFLRYLTAYSFRKYNPDWKIKVHVPVTVCEEKTWKTHEHKRFIQIKRDYSNDLEKLDVEIIKHDFSKYNFRNNVPETYKADFIRWKILSEQGGVWSDFDIIYTKPIENMPENTIENKGADTGICVYGNKRDTAIGFLFGSPNNEFWSYIKSLCNSRFDPSNYQSIGSHLLNNKFNSIIKVKNAFRNLTPIYINVNTVYLLDASKINQFYNSNTPDVLEDKDAIGFHWYAGANISQQYESSLTEENVDSYQNTISHIVQEVFP